MEKFIARQQAWLSNDGSADQLAPLDEWPVRREGTEARFTTCSQCTRVLLSRTDCIQSDSPPCHS